jgi:Transposase IS116/IS110/IS902 family
MSVPGIGPVISSGTGDSFSKGRDFAAWLGLVPSQISTGDRTFTEVVLLAFGIGSHEIEELAKRDAGCEPLTPDSSKSSCYARTIHLGQMRPLDDIRGTSGLRTTSGPSCGTVIGRGSATRSRQRLPGSRGRTAACEH